MRRYNSTVLLLSSDALFSRDIKDSWPRDSEMPEFVVLDPELGGGLQGDTFDLAIADASTKERRIRLKQAIVAAGNPGILATPENCAPSSSGHTPIYEFSREAEAWAAIVGLLGREILRRRQSELRAREADRSRSVAEGEAMLGRYMAEMRTNVNNALTSILGNAELLLLEPGLPANVLTEADTIRNMALRLNEVFQRFSSIEKELSVAAREAEKKPGQARGAAGGV